MAASESNLFARASKVAYIASLNKYFWTRVEDVGGGGSGCCLRACLQGERVTLALTHFPFFLRCVYKASRVTRVCGLPYLRARVTLAGRLTFFLVKSPVNPPTRVNFLLVSRLFECSGCRATLPCL